MKRLLLIPALALTLTGCTSFNKTMQTAFKEIRQDTNSVVVDITVDPITRRVIFHYAKNAGSGFNEPMPLQNGTLMFQRRP